MWKSRSHHLNRSCDQVDHGDVVFHVSLPSGPGSCRLEQTIEAFEPGIGVQGMPTMKDLRQVRLLKLASAPRTGSKSGQFGGIFGRML